MIEVGEVQFFGCLAQCSIERKQDCRESLESRNQSNRRESADSQMLLGADRSSRWLRARAPAAAARRDVQKDQWIHSTRVDFDIGPKEIQESTLLQPTQHLCSSLGSTNY